MYKMGSSAFASGDHESASENLLKCAEIRDANSVRDSAYINVLFVIGNLYKMQDNEDEAKRWWTRGYDMYLELGMNEAKPQIGKEMESHSGHQEGRILQEVTVIYGEDICPSYRGIETNRRY